MFQLELRPHEQVVISSEDIRAMFYIIGIPSCWKEYFAFSRPIPESMKPPGSGREDVVLFSKVLPMGYLNSVAVAQHLRRRLVIQVFKGQVSSSQEIRSDREFPNSPFYFRTYLDNFDLLTLRFKGILNAQETSIDWPFARNIPSQFGSSKHEEGSRCCFGRRDAGCLDRR